MRKLHVIVNPIAGGKNKEPLAQQIAAHRLAQLYEVSLSYTEARYHATQLAQKALDKGADIVAVAGGDGTVNEVAQALVGSSIPLALIPCGSGNGLARHLQIPLDVTAALELIEGGRVKSIDSMRLNDSACLGVAGMGFDAEVGWSFSEAGYRGFCAYFFATLKKLPFYRPVEYQLQIDGISYTRTAFLICIANSCQFGSDAYISPQAQIDDGLLDVVILKKFSPFYLPFIAYRLFHGSLHCCKYVEIIRCKEITLLQPNLKVHMDGEPVFFSQGFQGRVLPSSLKVIAPWAL